jgi:hypothetical protein
MSRYHQLWLTGQANQDLAMGSLAVLAVFFAIVWLLGDRIKNESHRSMARWAFLAEMVAFGVFLARSL